MHRHIVNVKTVHLLRRETLEFTAADMWPSNSPDLSPVDYCVLG